jgi:plasmid stabilization system protein ParE
MAHVVVSARAHSDLSQILQYLVANAGFRITQRYVAAFDALYDRLADFPDSCPSRPALGPRVRVALVAPFMVAYDHHNGTVTVLRILHGKRNITRDLLEG